MINLKKNKDIYLLNYLLIIIYVIVFINLTIELNDNFMFSTIDSATYWLTGNEFYKFSETGYSEYRPFLYPLILILIHKLFGLYGIWIMQLLFWVVSINVTFLALKRITNNRIISCAGSLIIALNITYIVLTMHALTEATTILLLSLLLYFVSVNEMKKNTLKFFHGCLLILVLLAVVKPVFYLPVLLMLCIILPVFYFKQYIQHPKSLIMLIFITIPLLFQLTIMKVKYNTFSFSQIGSASLRSHLFAQGIQKTNNISLKEARIITKKFSTTEMVSYILNNKMVYINTYLENLKENIKAIPCFTLYPNDFTKPAIAKYMIFINTCYYYIHIIFAFPVLIFIYFAYRKKQMNSYLVPAILSAFLTYYIFFTSPVSFREGDRVTLISLPLWVFLYALVLNSIFKKFKHSEE